jgi:hypothetical protein
MSTVRQLSENILNLVEYRSGAGSPKLYGWNSVQPFASKERERHLVQQREE